jgi:hypothetical protein
VYRVFELFVQVVHSQGFFPFWDNHFAGDTPWPPSFLYYWSFYPTCCPPICRLLLLRYLCRFFGLLAGATRLQTPTSLTLATFASPLGLSRLALGH